MNGMLAGGLHIVDRVVFGNPVVIFQNVGVNDYPNSTSISTPTIVTEVQKACYPENRIQIALKSKLIVKNCGNLAKMYEFIEGPRSP